MRSGLVFASVLFLSECAGARGDAAVVPGHAAQAWGSVQVLDGGSAEHESDSAVSNGPGQSLLVFGVVDQTREDGLGAAAEAKGWSVVYHCDDEIWISVQLDISYTPSELEGGDRPGGTVAGRLLSAVEFRLPTTETVWTYRQLIDCTEGFSGSSLVVVENVTRSQRVLELGVHQPLFAEVRLRGEVGDLIRVSTEISGSGRGDEGAMEGGRYSGRADIIFAVPEPGIMLLLFIGAAIAYWRGQWLRGGRGRGREFSGGRLGNGGT